MFSFKLKAALVGYLAGASVVGFHAPQTAVGAEAASTTIELQVGDRIYSVDREALQRQARDLMAAGDTLFAKSGGTAVGIHPPSGVGAVTVDGNRAPFAPSRIDRDADGRVVRVVIDDGDGELRRVIDAAGDPKYVIVIITACCIITIFGPLGLGGLSPWLWAFGISKPGGGSSGSTLGTAAVPAGSSGPLFTFP